MKFLGPYIRHNPRMAAAMAFGAVTMVVQHFLWVSPARMSGFALALTVTAALAHAIAGAITGPRLVVSTQTPSQAGLLGAGTSLLALLLFTFPFTFFIIARDVRSTGAPSYVAFPFLVTVFAFLGDGWALLVTSMITGWALHCIARRNASDCFP